MEITSARCSETGTNILIIQLDSSGTKRCVPEPNYKVLDQMPMAHPKAKHGREQEIDNGRYQHFTGPTYEVLDVVPDYLTGAWWVIYKLVGRSKPTQSVRLTEFAGLVDKHKYPHSINVHKYTKLEAY